MDGHRGDAVFPPPPQRSPSLNASVCAQHPESRPGGGGEREAWGGGEEREGGEEWGEGEEKGERGRGGEGTGGGAMGLPVAAPT